jgi:hypothetical protein
MYATYYHIYMIQHLEIFWNNFLQYKVPLVLTPIALAASHASEESIASIFCTLQPRRLSLYTDHHENTKSYDLLSTEK